MLKFYYDYLAAHFVFMSFKLNAISGTFVDAAAAAAPESFNSLNIYRFSGLRAQGKGKGKEEPLLAFPGKKRISLFFSYFLGFDNFAKRFTDRCQLSNDVCGFLAIFS